MLDSVSFIMLSSACKLCCWVSKTAAGWRGGPNLGWMNENGAEVEGGWRWGRKVGQGDCTRVGDDEEPGLRQTAAAIDRCAITSRGWRWGEGACGVLWGGFSYLESLLMTRIKAPFSSFSLWLSAFKSGSIWKKIEGGRRESEMWQKSVASRGPGCQRLSTGQLKK